MPWESTLCLAAQCCCVRPGAWQWTGCGQAPGTCYLVCAGSGSETETLCSQQGEFAAALQLHTCTVRLSLEAGLLLGGDRSPAILSSDLLLPARSLSVRSVVEEPSLPPPSRQGSPIFEVRGDGTWPADRSCDSVGISGGAWLSLHLLFLLEPLHKLLLDVCFHQI